MTELASILERESLTVEAPDDFERLVRRRDRKRRNRRFGSAALALVLAALATVGLARAFRGVESVTPAERPSIAPSPVQPPSVTPVIDPELPWIPPGPADRGAIASTATCPPGSRPDEPGPADQVRPPSRRGPMTFDRDAHRIVVLIGEHRDEPARARLWSFDICTNTWSRMGPGVPLTNQDDDPPIVYDPGSGRVLLFGAGSVWTYDPVRDGWSRSDAPTNHGRVPGDAILDPLTGRIWVLQDERMWSYEPIKDGWREIDQSGEIPRGWWGEIIQPGERPPGRSGAVQVMPIFTDLVTYVASVDRLVMYVGYFVTPGDSGPTYAGTWEFDPREMKWVERSIDTPSIVESLAYIFIDPTPSAVYDEASDRMIVRWVDRALAYDATAHRWSKVPEYAPEPDRLLEGADLVYDPVNERLVLFGGGLWGFDLATGTWTELLAPTVQP